MSLILNGSSGDGSSFAAAVNAGHEAAAFTQTAFDTYWNGKDSDDLAEGTTTVVMTLAERTKLSGLGAAADITGVVAGTNLSGGGSSGEVT